MTASRPIAAASFALLALLFTGCAATGSADDAKSDAKADTSEAAPAADQSKEEACEIVEEAFTGLQSLSSVDMSDPAAAVEALKSVEQTVNETAEKISNPEVKEAADSAAAAVAALTAAVDGMVSDAANADLTKLSDQLTAYTEGLTELGTVCA